MVDFQNRLICRIFCLFQRFFAQNNSSVLIDMFFCMFLDILIFDPNSTFCRGYRLCMGYSHCKMADFQNRLIARIFGVFSSGFFAQNNSSVLIDMFFACF